MHKAGMICASHAVHNIRYFYRQGEIIGGGQRSADLQYLESQIAKFNLPRAAYEWYLDLRRYGTVPHCGFGLGVERTVAWVCKLDHVRETIPYPRMLEKIYP